MKMIGEGEGRYHTAARLSPSPLPPPASPLPRPLLSLALSHTVLLCAYRLGEIFGSPVETSRADDPLLRHTSIDSELAHHLLHPPGHGGMCTTAALESFQYAVLVWPSQCPRKREGEKWMLAVMLHHKIMYVYSAAHICSEGFQTILLTC